MKCSICDWEISTDSDARKCKKCGQTVCSQCILVGGFTAEQRNMMMRMFTDASGSDDLSDDLRTILDETDPRSDLCAVCLRDLFPHEHVLRRGT